MFAKNKPTHYPNRARLAAALDVRRPTVTRLMRRDDWPVGKSPPWTAQDVAVIQRWRADALREDRAHQEHQPVADPAVKALRQRKLEQEIRKLQAQADGAELALSKERGELVPRLEVEDAFVARITMVRESLQRLVRSLPIALIGLDLPAMEQVLESTFRGVCNDYARELSKGCEEGEA